MSGGTVPPELVLTDQIPNLVIVERSTISTRVVLVELTVPWDTSTSFQAAFDRKTEEISIAIFPSRPGYRKVQGHTIY